LGDPPHLPPGLEGLGPGVLRPNHPDCRRHTPGEPWGVGEGEGDADVGSPGLMVSLRAAGACVRVPPPAPQACAALGWAPTMIPRAGVERAPPGGRVPRWEALCPAAALTELRKPI